MGIMAGGWFSETPKKKKSISSPDYFDKTAAPTVAWELDSITMLTINNAEDAQKLADDAFKEGNWQLAEDHMNQAVHALAAESSYSEELGVALCELSRIFSDNRKFAESRDVALKALSIAEVLGFDSEVAMCALARRLVAAVRL